VDRNLLTKNKKEWFVLVNPNAGTRKGYKDWDKIRMLLTEAEIPHQYIFTKHKEHAISITSRNIKKGYRKFLVVGGDGTLNEVVNGIFLQKNQWERGMIGAGCLIFPLSMKRRSR